MKDMERTADMNIRKLIGEATEYEKKEKLEEKEPRSWLKSVSAFANGIGGVLIFGIADKTDEIVGLEEPENTAEKISRFLRDRMDPIPPFVLRFQTEEDKHIIILDVRPGNETPYYYIGRNERTAYQRVGNESVVCNAVKLRELALKGSGRSFDSLPSGYDFSKMAFTKLISTYYQRTKKDFQESDYLSFGLVDGNGALTNAGALLADNCPIYQSRLFCTRWNGLNKSSGLQDALDDAEYTGSLVSLLQEGEAFVKRNSRKGWFKAPDRRIELPDYPERSVTEGIVNALIHRDYTEYGSEVHIDIYDDRLEIYSPGGMFDGVNVQDRDILSVPSRRRNPIIADVFSRLDYMERRGSGFKKIIDDYRIQYRYTEEMTPVFLSEHDAFFLTLKNLNYLLSKEGDEKSAEKKCEKKVREKSAEKKITKRTQEQYESILSAMRPDIWYKAADFTGVLPVGERRINVLLSELVDLGKIERSGSTKGRRYRIGDS